MEEIERFIERICLIIGGTSTGILIAIFMTGGIHCGR